jgi:DNA-directed RNA polymerase subunit RPC12/RpoP
MEILQDYAVILLIVLIIFFGVVTALRASKKMTSMKGFRCKAGKTNNIYCDIHRVPRSTITRIFSLIIPTKNYACHDCSKRFTKLKPLREKKNGEID